MSKRINFYLLGYALKYILRYKGKNIFIWSVLSILIFLLSSLFFVSDSIKYELFDSLKYEPDIVVLNQNAMRYAQIKSDFADRILSIDGVGDAKARVYGKYHFEVPNIDFLVFGVDEFERYANPDITQLLESGKFNATKASLNLKLYNLMQQNYYKDYFNFITPSLKNKRIYFGSTFKLHHNLKESYVMVMSKDNVREIFAIKQGYATDIAVDVTNKDEIALIGRKILDLLPNAKLLIKDDLFVKYQNLFDYKSGIFLTFFTVALFTFFMIVYDKASGLSSEEKREIGVLKALGWKIDDVLKAKFYEAFIISFFAYIFGVALAVIFVFVFKAPLFLDIFKDYNYLHYNFTLPYVVDYETMFLIFFISVPIYIASIILPSWSVATRDADEVMR